MQQRSSKHLKNTGINTGLFSKENKNLVDMFENHSVTSFTKKKLWELIGGYSISNRNVQKKARATMNGKCNPCYSRKKQCVIMA